MFVCMCELFSIKDFSGTTAPRILKCATNVWYDLLYCVRENQRFFNYTPGIQSICMPKGYIVFICTVHPFIYLSFPPSVIPYINTCYNQVLLQSFLIKYVSAATFQKLFIFCMGVPWRVLFHSMSMNSWVMPRGRARGQNLGPLNKVVYFSLFIQTTS